MMIGILIVIGIVGVICYFLFDSYMWRKVDINGILQEDLKKRGGILQLVEKTRLFDTGPFPKLKFEVKAATKENPAIIVRGIPVGNKTIFKKVIWTDKENRKRISWAKMQFVPFYKLLRIEWKDEE